MRSKGGTKTGEWQKIEIIVSLENPNVGMATA